MVKRSNRTGTDRAVLPSGTVTFLFTDMVGSTHLARDYADAWPTIQARHHRLLQTAIDANHGYVFQIIGDEFQAAFSTARDALQAALAAQAALRAEDWGEIESMHVRMGLHTGPAVPRDGQYEGYLTLAHTKRLMSMASGDQILVSEAAQAVLGEVLPADVSLRDLGKHRLKDFDRGETIYQVVALHLPADFPPLKSQSAPPNNLPVQLTSFVGRSRELVEVKQVLATERLLTLTGPGGSGKTRLALQAAAEMVEHFEDGVYFAALAPITDAGIVPLAIAQSLNVTEIAGRSIMDRLKDYLQNKSLLLVLDNFEQVIAAAPLVAELLKTGSGLKVIITSREGLHISGEREYPVPPLELPDPSQLTSLEALSQYSAFDLFLQRAKAVKPDLQITDETAPLVAEICYRLEGLPLAIELAAARIKLLPPRAMLERLSNRLEFLTGGRRDLPKRQQTLRNAIAWSYELLDENDQRLFRRLSVFVGGWTMEAAEAVSDPKSDPVSDPASDPLRQTSILEALGSLQDKSLLQALDGPNNEPRFMMLETLREFGLDQLAASGEQDAVRGRHAIFYLALAEKAVANLENVAQVQWVDRMEQEHDNLLAALEWSRSAVGAQEGTLDGKPSGLPISSHDKGKPADVKPSSKADICLRLAGALGFFWEARGYYSEGREWLAAILATDAAQGRTAARARLLARSAELAYRQSDFLATTNFAKESLSIYRELEDWQGVASALIKLGNAATELGNYAAASEYLEEALMIWRKRGDQHGIARALISFGWVALRSGSYPMAKARLEKALAISRALGDTRSLGFELAGLGEVALRQGDYPSAARLVEESLELRRRLGNKWGIAVSLGILGWIAMREENWERAMQLLGESLQIRQEIGDLSGSAWCLERLASVIASQGQTEKAVRLFGFAADLRISIRSVIDPSDTPAYESRIRSVRTKLSKAQFAAAWDEGRALTLEQAVDEALGR